MTTNSRRVSPVCVLCRLRLLPARVGFSRKADADIVQELYLKELQNFEAPKKSADAHKGAVREFKQPAAPKQPASANASEITSQLDAFQGYEPDAVPEAARGEEEVAETQDVNAYLAELQADPKLEAHH